MDQQVVAGGYETQAFGCTSYSGEWPRPRDCAGGFFHAGEDLGCAFRAPVYSTRAGMVVAIGLPFLGPAAVAVRADEGVFLEWGHLDQAAVAVGQRVAVGQLIGWANSRGASTGNHVHLEARSDGPNQGPPWSAVLDPLPYLVNSERGDAVAVFIACGDPGGVAGIFLATDPTVGPIFRVWNPDEMTAYAATMADTRVHSYPNFVLEHMAAGDEATADYLGRPPGVPGAGPKTALGIKADTAALLQRPAGGGAGAGPIPTHIDLSGTLH